MKPKKLNSFRVDEILENKRLIQAICDANPCFTRHEIKGAITNLTVNQNMIDLISTYMNWEEDQFIMPEPITCDMLHGMFGEICLDFIQRHPKP